MSRTSFCDDLSPDGGASDHLVNPSYRIVLKKAGYGERLSPHRPLLGSKKEVIDQAWYLSERRASRLILRPQISPVWLLCKRYSGQSNDAQERDGRGHTDSEPHDLRIYR